MRNLILWCLAVAVAVGVAGCRKKPRMRALPAEIGVTGGQLLFGEDFEGGLERWSTGSRNWRVEGGRLFTGDRPNNNEGLWLKDVALPEKVRIEFEATAVKGNLPQFEGDLKVEFGGRGHEHASGYIVIFGGWKNTVNTIARGDEHGDGRLAVDSARKVEEGVTYRHALVRLEGEVKWFIARMDEGTREFSRPELMLRVTDDEPALGGDFGFNNWNSRVYFDKLRIFAL